MSHESTWAVSCDQLFGSRCLTSFLMFTDYVLAASSIRVISASEHCYPH